MKTVSIYKPILDSSLSGRMKSSGVIVIALEPSTGNQRYSLTLTDDQARNLVQHIQNAYNGGAR